MAGEASFPNTNTDYDLHQQSFELLKHPVAQTLQRDVLGLWASRQPSILALLEIQASLWPEYTTKGQ